MAVRVEKSAEYAEWLDRLRDVVGRARIQVRVERLIAGNPGDHRNLSNGVAELNMEFGPGYCVYYSQHGERLLLLVGGDKFTQQADIRLALKLVKNFEE